MKKRKNFTRKYKSIYLVIFHFADEEMLSNFLLRGKLSLEKTKKIIDNYYTARAIMPDIFQDRDPCQKEIEDVYKYA